MSFRLFSILFILTRYTYMPFSTSDDGFIIDLRNKRACISVKSYEAVVSSIIWTCSTSLLILRAMSFTHLISCVSQIRVMCDFADWFLFEWCLASCYMHIMVIISSEIVRYPWITSLHIVCCSTSPSKVVGCEPYTIANRIWSRITCFALLYIGLHRVHCSLVDVLGQIISTWLALLGISY